jgi:hypothetical protein
VSENVSLAFYVSSKNRMEEGNVGPV